MSNLASIDTRSAALLRLENIHVQFPVYSGGIFRKNTGNIHAVRGVSLSISAGEIVGLVGESGCGKSTLAKAIVGLCPVASGNLYWQGDPMAHNRVPRERKIQMVFQDPYASLNPRLTIYETLSEAIAMVGKFSSKMLLARTRELLARVGLGSGTLLKYPHEFSGGQRQRIALARALATEPELIIADEAVSALDVSVQAQILNLLKNLVQDLGLALLFIGHDLSVMHYLSDRIAVMYAGQIVEEAPTPELFAHPYHPYTQALLAAIPSADPIRAKAHKYARLQGEPPSPLSPPRGCIFHPRCVYAQEICKAVMPPLENFRGHPVACIRAEAIAQQHKQGTV
ncbi:MAG TPA: ABC transporter ATP-binding protein [Opitutales bacterium]|nr:ABC transporter ATP-binding protein [Opitutales bacterium]